MHREKIAAAVLLCLLTGPAFSAEECYQPDAFDQMVKREGFNMIYMGDEISVDESTARQTKIVAGVTMTIREYLESQLNTAISAEDAATNAVKRGTINVGDEAKFVSTVREMMYLNLKQYGAGAAIVGAMVQPNTRTGIFLRRAYFFPDNGRSGRIENADPICIQEHLSKMEAWPKGQEPTAARFLKVAERPSCDGMPASFSCKSLTQPLQAAKAVGQVPDWIAQGVTGGWIFMLNSDQRTARALFYDKNGTTLVVDRLNRIRK